MGDLDFDCILRYGVVVNFVTHWSCKDTLMVVVIEDNMYGLHVSYKCKVEILSGHDLWQYN